MQLQAVDKAETSQRGFKIPATRPGGLTLSSSTGTLPKLSALATAGTKQQRNIQREPDHWDVGGRILGRDKGGAGV